MPQGGELAICTRYIRNEESDGTLVVAGTHELEDGAIRLIVQDTGHGIPPEYVQRIFEPFFTTRQAQQGTGLGLAICHRAVSLAGGRLAVQSVVGQGTPSRSISRCGGDVVSERNSMESESWILVVDDDRHNREMLGEALQRAGFHVVLASGVVEAMETAGGRDFDAIMSDIKMSPLSGMDLLQRFRDSSPETPVVLLTAFGSLETAIQAMKQGAFDYITKPVI